MAKKSELSVKDRRDAVLMMLRKERSGSALARQFGVSEPTLYRWRDDFIAGGEAALAEGKGDRNPRDRQIQELEEDIEKRDQVIGELTIANRILKKTSDGSSRMKRPGRR